MHPSRGFFPGIGPMNQRGFQIRLPMTFGGNQIQPVAFNFPHPMVGQMENNRRFVVPNMPMHNSQQNFKRQEYNERQRGQKRHIDDRESQRNKRVRGNDSPTPTPCPETVQPLKLNENFQVPVNPGTEKITIDIWNYFLKAQMTEDDLKKKLELRKSLFSVVEEAFPNCRLFIVGSSMTGFATRKSDMDMCLMISQQMIDQKREATLILEVIAKALRKCSFVRSSQVIKAKVPILKFIDAVSGVECDLNINNTVGIRNTHLLRCYAYMDWRVRPLMLYIKQWARFHDINDASKKTISSYSLSLMLIHYLQAGISPPVLPCLQKLRPELFNSSQDVRRLSLNFDDRVKFESKNVATLGELFLGFLNYYSHIFSFKNELISVRLGSKLQKNYGNLSGELNQWKCLCIEEPFEKSNTARSVYDHFVFWRVLRVFRTSFDVLQRTRDTNSILSMPL